MELNTQPELGTADEIEIPEGNSKKKRQKHLSLGLGETKLVLESNGHSLELHSTQGQSMEQVAEIALWLMQNLKGQQPKDNQRGSYLG